MKGFSTVMKGSLALNSTRFARFCIPLAMSLSVRSALGDGGAINRNTIGGGGGWGW